MGLRGGMQDAIAVAEPVILRHLRRGAVFVVDGERVVCFREPRPRGRCTYVTASLLMGILLTDIHLQMLLGQIYHQFILEKILIQSSGFAHIGVNLRVFSVVFSA